MMMMMMMMMTMMMMIVMCRKQTLRFAREPGRAREIQGARRRPDYCKKLSNLPGNL